MKKILFMFTLVICLFSVFLIGSCNYGDKPEATTSAQPASFSVSNLNIWPVELEYLETVTISVTVANTGGSRGSYDVVLYMNGLEESAKSVAIAAGGSEDVIFYLDNFSFGTYQISIDELSGSFEVIEPWPMGE